MSFLLVPKSQKVKKKISEQGERTLPCLIFAYGSPNGVPGATFGLINVTVTQG